VVLLWIKRPNAFLQSQQTLVDFSSFQTTLSVVRLAVRSSFTSRKIDKQQFAWLSAVYYDRQLADCMRPRAGIICGRLVRCPDWLPVVDDCLHVTRWVSLLLFNTKHLDLVILVFQNLEFLFVVQQVHALTAIDFKKGHKERDTLFALSNFEDIVDGVLRDWGDRKSFAWASLSVSEASDDASIKQTGQKIADRVLIHILAVFILVESVVEFKVCVVDILGDAVHFELRLVHHDLRVTRANCVDFSGLVFLVEQGSLSDANANVHCGRAHVVQGSADLCFVLVHQHVEVGVCVVAAHFVVYYFPLCLR
jgi:hypothetical protein